jgi:hypothetical protein
MKNIAVRLLLYRIVENTSLKRYSVRLHLLLFVGGRMSYLRYLCLFTYSGVQHIVLCFCFVFLRIVYPMLLVFLRIVYPTLLVFLRIVYPTLLVSLDCPFLIAPSVVSNFY